MRLVMLIYMSATFTDIKYIKSVQCANPHLLYRIRGNPFLKMQASPSFNIPPHKIDPLFVSFSILKYVET
jgi:hypothetical protein